MIASLPLAPAVCQPAIAVRKGGTADYFDVAALAKAVYGVPRSIDSVRWLYRANPAGACRLWLAEDAATSQVVALRPVFPWRLRVRGRDVLAGQAGDAMTHPGRRGQGLFSALVRASWSEMRDDGVPFTFSFSNPGSLSVYRKITIGTGPRVGTHVVLWFRRLVCLLSLRGVRERLPLPDRVTRRVDAPYQEHLRRRWALPSHLTAFAVERFDEEFDDLWARTADSYGALTVRDSRYLNWRFLDPPAGRFEVLGLRSRGCLAGYVAYEVTANGHGYLADLFAAPDPALYRALLSASLRAMLDRGCTKVSLAAATGSPFLGAIRECGFVARSEKVPLAVHVYHDGPDMDAVLDPAQWLAWFGDRDVEQLAPAPFHR